MHFVTLYNVIFSYHMLICDGPEGARNGHLVFNRIYKWICHVLQDLEVRRKLPHFNIGIVSCPQSCRKLLTIIFS